MKFCYLDESGKGDTPFEVMVGVITDSTRMSVTKSHWRNFLEYLSEKAGKSVSELHTREFYAGNGPWKGISGPERKKVISAVFEWIANRKHSIVFTAIDKARFDSEFKGEQIGEEIPNSWIFMASHIALCLQKEFQRQAKPKGNFLLIFDEGADKKKFSEILLSMPDWTDSYYAKKKGEKLDQLIDVPHFVDSKHVGLVQLADFVAFFLRKYVELKSGTREPDHSEELKDLELWMNTVFAISIPNHLKRNRCKAGDLFFKYYPDCLKT